MENNTAAQSAPQRKGTISRFAETFGFIKSRNPDTPALLETFFVQLSNLNYCEPELPRVGDMAAFDVSPLPVSPGKCRFAINVHVYAKLEPTATGANALAGVQPEKGDAGGAQ
jgi:hypothetical protein